MDRCPDRLQAARRARTGIAHLPYARQGKENLQPQRAWQFPSDGENRVRDMEDEH